MWSKKMKEVYEYLSPVFLNIDPIVFATTFAAVAAGHNVLLFGPGGYGKTTMAKMILAAAMHPRDLETGGLTSIEANRDMTMSEVLGLIDARRLFTEGVVERDKTMGIFYAAGLIINEIFNMPGSMLTALFEIFNPYSRSAKTYESGKTDAVLPRLFSVIATTNMVPQQIEVDPTGAALRSRFFAIPVPIERITNPFLSNMTRRYLKSMALYEAIEEATGKEYEVGAWEEAREATDVPYPFFEALDTRRKIWEMSDSGIARYALELISVLINGISEKKEKTVVERSVLAKLNNRTIPMISDVYIALQHALGEGVEDSPISFLLSATPVILSNYNHTLPFFSEGYYSSLGLIGEIAGKVLEDKNMRKEFPFIAGIDPEHIRVAYTSLTDLNAFANDMARRVREPEDIRRYAGAILRKVREYTLSDTDRRLLISMYYKPAVSLYRYFAPEEENIMRNAEKNREVLAR